MSKVECSHCHLEFDESVMIVEGEHYFCCNGCQGVFHLLSESGLDGFYEKAANTKLTPQTAQYEDATNFDAPAFYERFVTTNAEGFQEVSLVIEGIRLRSPWTVSPGIPQLRISKCCIRDCQSKSAMSESPRKRKLLCVIKMSLSGGVII